MSERLVSLALAALAAACLVSGAAAQQVGWSEDFDSYPNNILLPDPANNTGWEEWDDNWSASQTRVKDVAAGAAVRSAPQSIWLRGASDTIRRFDGKGPLGPGPYTSGQWSLGGWMYKPVTTTGHTMTVPSWFLALNTYNHGGTYNWSVQVNFSPLSGNWVADTATTSFTGPCVFDQWVELRCQIDLDADVVELFYDGASMGPTYPWNGGVSGFGSGASEIAVIDLFADGALDPTSRVYWDDFFLSGCPEVISYCTAGTSAGGCQAMMSVTGVPSATATSGFSLVATGVEGGKNGTFLYGANGRAALPWGNGTSYRCVMPPAHRSTFQFGNGTLGACDGAFTEDLNARWCPTCSHPGHNPGPGASVQAQAWYRDPESTSNQPSSFSDAVEFTICP
jgi:hypothetical protein